MCEIAASSAQRNSAESHTGVFAFQALSASIAPSPLCSYTAVLLTTYLIWLPRAPVSVCRPWISHYGLIQKPTERVLSKLCPRLLLAETFSLDLV